MRKYPFSQGCELPGANLRGDGASQGSRKEMDCSFVVAFFFHHLTTGVGYAIFADSVDTEQLLVLATCEVRATLSIKACDPLHLPRAPHWMNKEVP